MAKINQLDEETINRIAAGEVVERPSAVVKELVENAIDAGSTSVTVEIKEGGILLIRVTDNGSGIAKEEIPSAFLRYSTSKIKNVDDLNEATTLGFRGEALSSIAAVSQVELVTKMKNQLMGSRYRIEGGTERDFEEIGCPDGSTFLVRNIFYNAPVRKKFLKTAATEGSYINAFVEKAALSHPDVAFTFINNNQKKLSTSGNGSLKDVIFQVFGRDIVKQLLKVDAVSEQGEYRLSGYIGKPAVVRGNKSFIICFVNGRYVKNQMLSAAIMAAYKKYLMNHQFPFCVLNLTADPVRVDVNVHPTKMEVRFSDSETVYQLFQKALSTTLDTKEQIPEVTFDTKKEQTGAVQEERNKRPAMVSRTSAPEPFEIRYRELKEQYHPQNDSVKQGASDVPKLRVTAREDTTPVFRETVTYAEQTELSELPFLSKEAAPKHKIIGQLFDTYWIVQYEDKMYLIDQHAAHEKVLFERNYRKYKKKECLSQNVQPPIIVSLSMRQEEVLKENLDLFQKLGFEVEEFGGREVAIYAVPADLYGLDEKQLFEEMLDELSQDGHQITAESVLAKLAGMSCKAAIKGNMRISFEEAKALIDELLELENPFNCPHGRPTMISMSKYEIEKKFHRIV